MNNDYLVSKAFKSYMVVSVLGILSSTLSIVIDALIVGNFIGTDGMAAVGLSTPIIMVISALANVFSKGGSVVCSNYIGRGEGKKASINFTITFLLSISLAFIITLTYPLYLHELSVILGAREDLIILTTQFLSGILMGTIPFVLSYILFSYTRLDGSPFLGLISMIVMTISNIVLDLVFITQLNLGMFGIGLATSISYLISVLILSLHFFQKKNTIHLCKLTGGFKELKNILSTGLPSALKGIYSTIRTLVTNNFAMWIGGAIVMGALSLQSNVYQFLGSIITGVGMGTMLLGGIFHGEKDHRALKDLLNISFKMGLMISGVVTVLVIIFAPVIGSAFTKNQEVIDTAAVSLRFLALYLPLSLIFEIFVNFYNSTKDMLITNYLVFADSFLFRTLSVIILTPLIGENGIWLSFALGEGLTLTGLIIIIKIKKGKFPKSINDFILLEGDSGDDIKADLNISLENNMEEVMDLSKKIHSFGKRYSVDFNTINKLSLCVEEMVGNIVQHGFESLDVCYIDIRIMIMENKIIFRIRDNGRPFNPIDYAHRGESGNRNIGIYMIQKLAKSMEYRHTIGLNNLTITL